MPTSGHEPALRLWCGGGQGSPATRWRSPLAALSRSRAPYPPERAASARRSRRGAPRTYLRPTLRGGAAPAPALDGRSTRHFQTRVGLTHPAHVRCSLPCACHKVAETAELHQTARKPRDPLLHLSQALQQHRHCKHYSSTYISTVVTSQRSRSRLPARPHPCRLVEYFYACITTRQRQHDDSAGPMPDAVHVLGVHFVAESEFLPPLLGRLARLQAALSVITRTSHSEAQ